jgi:hypothetical protein
MVKSTRAAPVLPTAGRSVPITTPKITTWANLTFAIALLVPLYLPLQSGADGGVVIRPATRGHAGLLLRSMAAGLRAPVAAQGGSDKRHEEREDTRTRQDNSQALQWVGTPLDTDTIDPHGIVEIVMEFDEGQEVIAPKMDEVFCSYDLHEVVNFISFTSKHLQKH